MILETPEHQLEEVLGELPEHGTLLEYGSGTSTIWFLEHMKPGQKLITIEHNARWYFHVKNELKDVSPRKFDFRFVQASNERFVHVPYGHFIGELPIALTAYIWGQNTIDEKSPIPDADVIFVDGIGRGAVLAVVAQKAKKDAVIFLHDAERSWYTWATKLLIARASTPSSRNFHGQVLAKFRRRV